MFGYIRPFKPGMQFAQWDIYKGIYCSICKRMGKKFGIFSRSVLSYDSVFFALVLLSSLDVNVNFEKSACVLNPLKKCVFFKEECEIIDFVSTAGVILAYYKVLDDICDSRVSEAIKFKLFRKLLNSAYEKAGGNAPEILDIAKRFFEFQRDIENSPSVSLDASCEPTARMLSDLFKVRIPDVKSARVLSSLGYFLGRWVYLADALDDIEKDFNRGLFNPFFRNLGVKTGVASVPWEIYDECECILNRTHAMTAAAYAIMERGKFSGILDNIIYVGIPAMQKHLLSEKRVRKL